MKSVLRNAIIMPLLCSVMVFMLGFTGPGYHIAGNVSAPNGTIIKLSYRYGNKVITDSVNVRKDNFTFKGSFPEPILCTLSNSLNQQIKVFIGQNSRIVVTGSVERFVGTTITNSPENDIYNQFKNKSNVISGRYNAMLKQTGAAKRDTNNMAFRVFRVSRDSLLWSFVGEHSNSTAAALAIIDTYINNPDRNRASACYRLLSTTGKQTIYAKRVQQYLVAQQIIAPGRKAPDFTLADINGEAVTLSNYNGKYVLLDFWASWCAPCREEHPRMRELYKKYGADKITFVSVSMDSYSPQWKQAVKTDSLVWTQLNDGQSMNGRVADVYGIKAIPFNCIIDPNGQIIATKLRGEKLSDFLTNLFEKAR